MKYFPVFFEKMFGEVKYGIGDEKSGNDVDGIVDVRHKDDDSEEDGYEGENNEKSFITPKNKRHQKRKTGMRGKEKVTAEGKGSDEIGRIINEELIRCRRDMRERNKNGTDKNKQRDAFYDKRYFFRSAKT